LFNSSNSGGQRHAKFATLCLLISLVIGRDIDSKAIVPAFSRMASLRIALFWWYLEDLNVFGYFGSWTKRSSRRHTARRAMHDTRPSCSTVSFSTSD
jgi:hypothetical protein